jgi:hypothetical protein
VYIFNIITNEIRELSLSISENRYTLQYVTYEMKTKELCELAISKAGYALQYIPDEMKTKELCEIAMQYNLYLI